jgi:hypothetical protein
MNINPTLQKDTFVKISLKVLRCNSVKQNGICPKADTRLRVRLAYGNINLLNMPLDLNA